jgi:hypothetical protein
MMQIHVEDNSSSKDPAIAPNEKVKSPVKEVLVPFLYFIFTLIFVFQTNEKRPEVRVCEYHEIPGMILDARWFYAQKLVSGAKKAKLTHASIAGPVSKSSMYLFSYF